MATLGVPTKQIVISGYYGFGNVGDEAVLQSILEALQVTGTANQMIIEPVVLSSNPVQTRNMFAVNAVSRTNLRDIWQALRAADGCISGGGSLLQDVTSRLTIPYYLGVLRLAQWLGKPTFIYAQGIGPVQRPAYHAAIRSVFVRAQYISVRDVQSQRWLQQLGLNRSIELVSDPVMGLALKHPQLSFGAEDAAPAPQKRKRIGVAVRFWQANTVMLERLAEVLNQCLATEDVEMLFLPFHLPHDEKASRFIMTSLDEQFQSRVQIVVEQDPRLMLNAVARCDLIIGMRLHALIYAANRNIPMMGISYDPKIEQFLARLGIDVVASTEQFDPAYVLAQIKRELANVSAWQRTKQPMIAQLQAEARWPAQAIVDYFRVRG